MNINSNDKEAFAAISYALHQELGRYLHDTESYVLTIKQNLRSAWTLKTQTLRKLPRH